MAQQRKAGFCTLCRSRCGAWYVTEGDRLVGVEPFPEHPTGQALCPKGRAAPELVYHAQRLRKPLKRTRPKTDEDPGWVEVSWDAAMTDIARRLGEIKAQSGAQAVAFSSASPGATPISDSLEWMERLIFAFGSPNFITGVEICNWYRDVSQLFTTGCSLGMPDYANSDLIVLWGFNPANAWLAQANGISAARARGAKLLVIDPAATRYANEADQWLRVKPGTDAALALGLARWIIERGRFDERFVRSWTNAPLLVREDTGEFLRAGENFLAWDTRSNEAVEIDTRQALAPELASGLALRGHFEVAQVRCRPAFDHYAQACAGYTPQRVEELTGIPAAQVEAAAAAIADAPRVSYFCWTGIAQHVNATQADRAIALLFALTGSIDAPGGNLELERQGVHKANDRSLMPPGQWAHALGLPERPLGPAAYGWALGRDVYRAIVDAEPYRVRALVGFGANLLLSQADTPLAIQALQSLEFQVHCDLFETPTARYADYLLPVNTPWEREGLRIGFEINAEAEDLIQLRQRIIAQAADDLSRSDLQIVFDLAVRLGLGKHFFDGDIEAAWNHQLAPVSLTVGALRQQPEGIRRPVPQRSRKYQEEAGEGVRGFATPTRRIEFYSQRLHAHGYPPVPRDMEPLRSVALDNAEMTRFPLTLTCAKSGYFCHSQHHGLPSLRKRLPEPLAHLHPELAAARGIAPGDWFRISTRKGSARFRASIDAALQPDLVLASYGWWQACDDLGLPAVAITGADSSHYNGLIGAEHLDEVAGSIALRAFPCEIAREEGAQGRPRQGWKAFRARRVADAAGAHPRGVIELALAAEDDSVLPDFHPGQYVPLAFDMPGLGRMERSYSLIGPAHVAQRTEYRVAIKRGQGAGSVSCALHDAGEDFPVWLQCPRGRFLLPVAGRAPVVLVAAGIGITPFLGLLETLAAEPAAQTPQITLYHCNRDAPSHAFAGRIARLAKRIPGLRVIDVYSRAAGRLTAATIAQELIDSQARFYLCGPEPMLHSLTDGLVARGVHRFSIFRESFGALASSSPRRRGSRAPWIPASAGMAGTVGMTPGEGPFTIRFERSKRELTWTAASGPLLQLGLEHGLPLPSGCRVGQCESCLLRVRSGQVRHMADVDLADEGTCLACVALPCSDMVLDA